MRRIHVSQQPKPALIFHHKGQLLRLQQLLLHPHPGHDLRYYDWQIESCFLLRCQAEQVRVELHQPLGSPRHNASSWLHSRVANVTRPGQEVLMELCPAKFLVWVDGPLHYLAR